MCLPHRYSAYNRLTDQESTLMNPEPARLATEIAHVLFMDLVGYSRFSMEEQARQIERLRVIVRQTTAFQEGEREQDLIALDTGDGMALVFFRDLNGPLRCATEIAQALGSSPEIKVRMGTNTGPVTRVMDMQGKANVSGGGINLAQRVMDCGDAGHILVSHSSADILHQFATWSEFLFDLGLCQVKHGKTLHLFNFVHEPIGRAEVPQKLRAVPNVPSSAPVTVGVTHPLRAPTGGNARQVAILHKRNAPHSAYLLDLLEKSLVASGFTVFVDRHPALGIAWAQELREQVRSSYAVVPLLSPESIWSEMIEDELQTAHEAQQKAGGKPRILPVRVGYEGVLPEPLAHILDHLRYQLWKSPEDDARLVSEIVRELKNESSAPTSLARERLEPVGGAVPLGSEFYIVRPSDEEFAIAMGRRDSIVLVKGARQMGKTSLLARGLQQAREMGVKCVRTDFQKLNAIHLESPDALYLTLAEMIADQLDLEVVPEDSWSARRGANVNFERFLRREILGKIDGHLVWAMDEVDRLFGCPFGSEVFGLFRSWHNERSLDPEGPWSRLTLAIAYATEAHLFITDINQSPFNVGTRLALADFNRAQVGELNGRYGSPLRGEEEVERFHALVGGQPYLVRRGLDQIVALSLSLEALEAQADQDEGIFGDHLRRILVTLSQDPALTSVVRGILRAEPITDPTHFYRLRSGGLLSGGSAHQFAMRCGLYERYLKSHLL